MSAIDWIVGLALCWAVFAGWRRGFVRQLCSFAGMIVGVWLASRSGAAVGRLMGLDPSIAAAGGFLAVMIVVLIVIAVAGWLLRKLFRAAGLGTPDIVLGIAVSVLKYLLVLCALFSAFDTLNERYDLVGDERLETSYCYEPLLKVSDVLFPLVRQAYDEIPLNHGDGA